MITLNRKVLIKALADINVNGGAVRIGNEVHNVLTFVSISGSALAFITSIHVTKKIIFGRDTAVCSEDGAVSVEMKKLRAVLKLSKESLVTISKEGVVYGQDVLVREKTYKTLAQEYVASFATEEEECNYLLSARTLDAIKRRVLPHVSEDETRYFLHGVMMSEEDNALRFCATNGRTLAVYNSGVYSNDQIKSVIIKPETFDTVKNPKGFSLLEVKRRAIGTAIVSLKTSNDEYSLTTFVQEIDGQFPNYKRVIPDLGAKRITFDNESFLSALKTVHSLYKEKYPKGFFDVKKGKLTFSIAKPGAYHNPKDRIDSTEIGFQITSCASFDNDETFIMNYDYLESSLIDKVSTEMTFNETNGAFRIDDDDITFVIMSMAF